MSETDDYTTAPMFAAIPPGNAWLRAQQDGATTYEVYSETDGAPDHPIVGIFFEEHMARTIAGDRPVGRTQNMMGDWIYPDDPPQGL